MIFKHLYKLYDATISIIAVLIGSAMIFSLGYGIGITSAGVFGVIFAVIMGLLIGFNLGWWLQAWRVNDGMRRHNEVVAAYTRDMGNYVIAGYFKDSQITNYVLTLSTRNELQIKVGDDDHMVDVDMELWKDDPMKSLEEAGRRWEDWSQSHWNQSHD